MDITSKTIVESNVSSEQQEAFDELVAETKAYLSSSKTVSSVYEKLVQQRSGANYGFIMQFLRSMRVRKIEPQLVLDAQADSEAEDLMQEQARAYIDAKSLFNRWQDLWKSWPGGQSVYDFVRW